MRYIAGLRDRMGSLKEFLALTDVPSVDADLTTWSTYLWEIKERVGNLHNDVSSVACLQAKEFLIKSVDATDYDSLLKAQGASGHDVEVRTPAGLRVVGEVKTTNPFAITDFGAQQKKMILADIEKLHRSQADLKYLFVTDRRAFEVLKCKYLQRLTGIELVLLPEGEGPFAS